MSELRERCESHFNVSLTFGSLFVALTTCLGDEMPMLDLFGVEGERCDWSIACT